MQKITTTASLLSLVLCLAPRAQLSNNVKVEPFYDVTKAGLSFAKDKQSVVGMFEVPGKPQHFLVVGYWGYVWSLYPDTTKAYAKGAIKDYTKKQVADFNKFVMKGWEQGALGGAFDPAFSKNRYFYVIYNKYKDPAAYHAGTTPNGSDGPGAAGLVVVERYKVSDDYASLIRDTTIFVADHSTGYGSSNMVFGKDGLLYITADAYSQNSWDSTIYMRKVMRIDVSKPEGSKMYTIPSDNPWYKVANPAVKKEVFAYGFRNTYSIQADYLTGHIWGAEVGQGTWEEVNIIQAGKNYGWGNGGDGASVGSNSIGIEGPCSPTSGGFTAYGTDGNNTGSASQQTPYTRTFNGRTYTCSDFTNGTWNFAHSGNDQYGSKTALPGTGISCIILSQAFRGDPASALYGYHFVTDVASRYFIAVKEGVAGAVKVGGIGDLAEDFGGDRRHNGPTSFSEDAYGNMYITMLSSSSNGAFAWHDIYRLSSPDMAPLTTPRTSVVPDQTTSIARPPYGVAAGDLVRFVARSLGKDWIRLPAARGTAAFYGMDGKLLWTGNGQPGANLAMPASMGAGALWVRFSP